jgi:hypothetical protein
MRCALPPLALVAAAAVSACGGDRGEGREAPTVPAAQPTLPVAEAPLSRAELLLAVVRAGSAAVSGANDAADQRKLDGKRFALRLRFGCEESGEGARKLRFDALKRRVELSFAPELDIESPQLAGLVPDGFEAAEGFWIRQPWLLEAACPRGTARTVPPSPAAADPAVRPPPAPSAAPTSLPEVRPHVGIARFFTERDSRTHRRERRAYETSESLLEGQGPSPSGYDLVIEGRLQALPDGRVIACSPQADTAPICVISASFGQVSLERADSGKMIAEWPSG